MTTARERAPRRWCLRPPAPPSWLDLLDRHFRGDRTALPALLADLTPHLPRLPSRTLAGCAGLHRPLRPPSSEPPRCRPRTAGCRFVPPFAGMESSQIICDFAVMAGVRTTTSLGDLRKFGIHVVAELAETLYCQSMAAPSMHPSSDAPVGFDPEQRAREKQASRDADDRAVAEGRVSWAEVDRKNNFFPPGGRVRLDRARHPG